MDEQPTSPALRAALEDAQALGREQIVGAWQAHSDRLRDALQAAWAAEARRLRSGFEAESAQSWNQTARRLRGAESRDEWMRTMVEASAPYCGKAAVLEVTPNGVRLGANPETPLQSAPAFGTAVESKDTVVAVGTPRELSPAISALLGDASSKKVYLFPVVVRQKVVAVLYAEPGQRPVDVSALELLVSLAAVSVESSDPPPLIAPAADLVRITAAPPPPPPPAPAASLKWTDLSRAEREQHLRAQRFARNCVAELLLHKRRQVEQGRAVNDLYGMLKEEIEAGREAFRKDFIETCPSMVDYFHLELEHTLARDRSLALGPGYPGPLPVGPSPGGSGAAGPGR